MFILVQQSWIYNFIFFVLLKFTVNNNNNYLITVEELDSVIGALSKGKAGGPDDLVAEHIIYAHPIVRSFGYIFQLFVHGYTPEAFGIGITIPIPKVNLMEGTWSFVDYRGITLRPVVSKIFERCVLLK